MPQKRSGATAGLEESGGSAGGAECSVTARRARCQANSQHPDRPRARDRTMTPRAALQAEPRASPPRRAGPPRTALSVVRVPSAAAPRRRRSPRAIPARRSALRELVEAAMEPGSCFASTCAQRPGSHRSVSRTCRPAPSAPLPPPAGSPAPPRQINSPSPERPPPAWQRAGCLQFLCHPRGFHGLVEKSILILACFLNEYLLRT